MNIAIDGYEANSASKVGIGRFAYEILLHLYSIAQQHKVTVFLPSEPRSDMPPETNYWQYKVIGPKKLWTFIGLPLALVRNHYDVVFSPTHYIPRFISTPRVMAIMDVSYLKYPELFTKHDVYKLTNWTAYSVAHAASIITISEFSKNAIIKAYRVPAERVHVAYPGLRMKQVDTHKANNRYILSVGTLQPRKNFLRLIEAFSLLPNREITLVIVGKKGWLYEEILTAPHTYHVENRVKFLDFVKNEELPGLYKNAACFVLPSLYEGFGLPVLEAMSYGVPVVVSRTSSLPEIAGEAGIYVDPENTESIKNGLEKALMSNNATRVNLGVQRAKQFTWDKTAEKVMKTLTEVYESAH